MITNIFTSISLYSASNHYPTCPKNLTGKGRSHQDSAPNVIEIEHIGIIVNMRRRAIVLKIAVTPHIVNFMAYLAMLQQLNVGNDACIAGTMDTACNFVANKKIVIFVASLAITQRGAGSTIQY